MLYGFIGYDLIRISWFRFLGFRVLGVDGFGSRVVGFRAGVLLATNIGISRNQVVHMVWAQSWNQHARLPANISLGVRY